MQELVSYCRSTGICRDPSETDIHNVNAVGNGELLDHKTLAGP